MIQSIPLVNLYCGCGRLVSHSFPTSQHYCRACDRWLVFKDGKLIDSSPMEEWKKVNGFKVNVL